MLTILAVYLPDNLATQCRTVVRLHWNVVRLAMAGQTALCQGLGSKHMLPSCPMSSPASNFSLLPTSCHANSVLECNSERRLEGWALSHQLPTTMVTFPARLSECASSRATTNCSTVAVPPQQHPGMAPAKSFGTVRMEQVSNVLLHLEDVLNGLLNDTQHLAVDPRSHCC